MYKRNYVPGDKVIFTEDYYEFKKGQIVVCQMGIEGWGFRSNYKPQTKEERCCMIGKHIANHHGLHAVTKLINNKSHLPLWW